MIPAPATVATPPPPTARDAWAIGLGAAAVAVALWPLRAYAGSHLSGTDAPKFALDSFPLSTYPMFSEHRGRAATVPHVVGLTDDGRRVIPHHRHFGPGGLNQVRRQVSRAVRAGEAADVAQVYADALAAQNAALARRRTPDAGGGAERRRRESEIRIVEVVRSRYRFDEHVSGGRRLPRREDVHARCAVGGSAVAVRERRTAVDLEAMEVAP